MISPNDITCIILCGGQGSRMGGRDKGLQTFGQIPLAQHVFNRIKDQVGTVIMSANRNLAQYELICERVYPDGDKIFNGDFEVTYDGPLAGFKMGFEHAKTPYLLTVPCDTPNLPLDLVTRLSIGLMRDNAQLAMVRSLENGILQPQPVFTLVRLGMKDHLIRFLTSGGKKITSWTSTLKTAFVDFDGSQDDPSAFLNFNSLEDLARFNQ